MCDFIYENEKEFKKLERALKKYNMLAFKELNFSFYPELRKGNFLGELVSKNKAKGTETYELKLKSDHMFSQVHGDIKLHYIVYKKEIQFVTIQKEKKVEKIVQPKEELIGIDEALKNEILSSLNDQESTSNRIDAIAKIADLPSIDHNLKESLYHLALNDNNTIVRLNALEALASKLPKSEASKELTDLFMKQDDPMVQMELIGMIAHINNDQIDLKLTNKLQEMVLDPTTKPFVKDEAYAVLFRK